MKRNVLLISAVAVIAALTLAGCASTSVRVRSYDYIGLSSVIKGGKLRLIGSGAKQLVWSVSSTPEGDGSVASGTVITSVSGGLRDLMVDPDETASVLYVFCKSEENPDLSTTMQVRVVTVTEVEITNKPEDLLVPVGGGVNMTARVLGENNPDQTVTWDVTPYGFILAGSLVVGKNVPQGARLTVTAKSVIDPSNSATATVLVVAPKK